METRMRAVVGAGDGLATAQALRAAGIPPRLTATWVRDGTLVAVRRGVYTTRELWQSWDVHRRRPLARVRAVSRTLRVPHVFSHDSAALMHGLPVLWPQDSAVHVTRRHLRASITSAGVHHHGARYDDGQVVEIDGLAALDIARTVVDVTREHGYRAGLVAADGAMQRGVSRAQLAAAAEAMRGWPRSLVVRAVVEDADPGAESAVETLGRELLMEMGLQPIETQFPVPIPGGVAWCDLRVGCHVVECDGRQKSRPVADGGLAHGDLEQLLWDERRRQREVCATGLGMSRLVWADFWGDARERAKERIRREEAVTRDRFGAHLPAHLEEFARRVRGRRYRATG
ncbi:type IV toxin-antitoxin system AbiEi family antitoxin domain-containing protein [Nocardioides coralli]|uniref:type IV toxin-antitoxin system AbiEi family antitoxin domain-containing protein n=1 Tax=Nocardioides coralli TaxID=2872154 RepID=UPI001CA3BD37|nr:hypothetical protein [Nocardioides coralli]QZY28866.1 hypothetical protein K6T13_15670 [Nocardioides coralli]